MGDIGQLMLAAFVGGLPVALVMGGVMWSRTGKQDREIEDLREAFSEHIAQGHPGTEARAHAADQRIAELIVQVSSLARVVDAQRVEFAKVSALLEAGVYTRNRQEG